jgi:hypothetical protein
VREHVGLERPGEALDGRPVESETLGERPLDLGRGDGHRLEGPDNVGEPETDELDTPLLDGTKNEVALLVHSGPFLFPPRLVSAVADRAKTGPARCRMTL